MIPDRLLVTAGNLTALTYASAKKHSDVAELLLKNGAKPADESISLWAIEGTLPHARLAEIGQASSQKEGSNIPYKDFEWINLHSFEGEFDSKTSGGIGNSFLEGEEDWTFSLLSAEDYRHTTEFYSRKAELTIVGLCTTASRAFAKHQEDIMTAVGLPLLRSGMNRESVGRAVGRSPKQLKPFERGDPPYDLFEVAAPNAYSVICGYGPNLYKVWIYRADIYAQFGSCPVYSPGSAPHPELPNLRSEPLSRISLFALKAKMFEDRGRFMSMANLTRPSVGTIRIVDLVFENGIELRAVPIEFEEYVTIPVAYVDKPVKSISVPIRERQYGSEAMSAREV